MNPTSRPTLRRWLVAGLIGAGLLLCLAALTIYFGATFSTVAIVVGILAALIPVGIVVPSFLWLDRFEAEPARYLIFAFLAGALVATALAMVANTGAMAVFLAVTDENSAQATTAIFVAPIVEESLKGSIVLLMWWFRRQEFDGIVDGLVYAGIVAAGFAFTENIQYMAVAWTDGGAQMLTGVFFGRGLLSPFAHPMFTSLTGLGIGIAAESRSSLVRVVAPVIGWVLAVIAHGGWNLLAFSGSGILAGYLFIGVPVFVAYTVFVIWVRRREGRLIGRYLSDYAAYGWLSPGEVEMLSSMRGRRQALGWARHSGGSQRFTAMRAFQDNASELALLRARMANGHATSTAPQTERRLLDALSRSRAQMLAPAR